MADLFANYESDFKFALQEAKSKLDQISTIQGDERKLYLKGIENAIEEGLEMIDQMAIEVQNLPTNQRSSYNTKIRQYKSQVDESKSRLNQILDNEDKRELFGGRYSDNGNGEFGDSIHDQQRKQLLNNNSSLERSSQRLKDSQRIALETESVGGDILNNLRTQREQIQGSRLTLSTADTYVDKSIKTLKSMSRRLVANKFISYAIIGVLIVLIFLVLASKFW
ncbi:t-SNARE [Scheffersomyces amazonensis]|uniref:t-SNARE n=1 Tax=Scheffersomyces amazonensis TaxID=1078765 RepID=UPI00315DAB01